VRAGTTSPGGKNLCACQKAANLAHQRFKEGVADFLSVLDAERTLLEAQDRLAASQTRTATACGPDALVRSFLFARCESFRVSV
jgi:hypothetical protein